MHMAQFYGNLAKNKHSHHIASIGEYSVLIELAKRKIHAAQVDRFLRFDIMTRSGIRIEVKTSTFGERNKFGRKPFKAWYFTTIGTLREKGRRKRLKRLALANFYIFVCLNEDQSVNRYYILPIEKIKPTMYNIHDVTKDIYSKDPRYKTARLFEKHRNKWSLITKDETI